MPIVDLDVPTLIKQLRNTDGIGRNILEERMKVAANILEIYYKNYEETKINLNRLESMIWQDYLQNKT